MIGQEAMASSCVRGGLDIRKKFFTERVVRQAAQDSGGDPIPGGVQKTCRCGILGHGLAGMVVLGGWLDLMILEVFSNLRFYNSKCWIRGKA